jgi:hypothetical protein
MGWQLEDAMSPAWMTDPNENIIVWIIASEALEFADALDAAFAQIEIGDDFTMVSSVSLPIGSWSGEDVQATYRSESSDDVVTVMARRPEGWSILLVARGPDGAINALSENLEWIWSELSIPAEELLLL